MKRLSLVILAVFSLTSFANDSKQCKKDCKEFIEQCEKGCDSALKKKEKGKVVDGCKKNCTDFAKQCEKGCDDGSF